MSDDKTYYAHYFWLAVITFAVPFFVAYKAFDKITPVTKPTPNPDASGVDHGLWDYLLKTYVKNGNVNYDGLKKDYLFKIYLRQLGSANVEALKTEDEKLALYCNAYNALVIQGVIRNNVQTSVKEIKIDGQGFFNLKEHLFANKTYSLNEIEHGIIRPEFKEPRVHMALVCAAKSCPAIRMEAYFGDRIQQQLEDQVTLFANNKNHVRYDESNDQVLINSVLDWYGHDFDDQGGYLKFLSTRAKSDVLKKKLVEADQKLIDTAFIDYDWSLNSTGPVGSGNYKPAESGSGSIPNE